MGKKKKAKLKTKINEKELNLSEKTNQKPITSEKAKELIKDTIENKPKEVNRVILNIPNQISNLEIDLSKKSTNKKELEYLVNYLESNYSLSHEVLSEHTSKHSDISKNVKRQLKYIGFVYYIWNIKNLNIKVIPLIYAYPVLDIVNLKEIYYLDKPSLFIDGIPIWTVIRNNPLSFEMDLVSKDGYFSDMTIHKYTSQEIRAKLKSGHSTYIFGKPSLTLREYIIFILILGIGQLLQYVILFTIFTSI